MKTFIAYPRAVLLGLCALLVATSDAWARLNVPRRHTGVAATLDKDARTLLLAEETKPKFRFGWIIKPKRFEWAERTEFIKNGQPTTAAALSPGMQVELHYWIESKRKPVLVKVSWKEGL